MIISLDCESTGLDLAHGALPFLVTAADDGGTTWLWEWNVDPRTRRVEVVPEDVVEIAGLIDAADLVYFHNAKFDIRALACIGVGVPWDKVRDTLVASHLLATNRPHTLAWLCVEYLGIDIDPYELTVKKVVQACRDIARRDHPDWLIAEEGRPGMPSVKASSKRDEDKPWKNDMWLPRALALANGKVTHAELPTNWLGACARYAGSDSENTLLLGLELEKLVQERGLWKIYEHRLELVRADAEMEEYGITARGDYTAETLRGYEERAAESEAAIGDIAREYGHALELAAGSSVNDSTRDFFYGALHQYCTKCKYLKRVKHWLGEAPLRGADAVCPRCAGRKRKPARVALQTYQQDNLGLPVVSTKKVAASLDKEALDQYLATTDGSAYDFVELYIDNRMYGTAIGYMGQYQRFGVPVAGQPDYYRIHAHFNPCGTDHLRQSSNSPNCQNVAGETKDLNLRACFGPLPDREWWRMDYKSIERRIPPYECGEPKMIAVFEKPNEPPYWGSLYYLTASVLYPDEFWPRSKERDKFKKECPRLYKRAKFFDLAKQYGCGRAKGDLLSQIDDSFDRVDNEFPRLAKLQEHYLRTAERTGYVETLPDKTVDPRRGYPILASRTEDGRVLSTTPFNYHVSGTACWIKNVALVRCSAQCRAWQAEGFDAHVSLEVHDELLFDFPRGQTMAENLPRALVLKKIMERGGEDLIPPIPSPVSVEYHTESWARGASV